jgi:hypothetical protein
LIKFVLFFSSFFSCDKNSTTKPINHFMHNLSSSIFDRYKLPIGLLGLTKCLFDLFILIIHQESCHKETVFG